MDKILSFQVDHINLKEGIYISRVDEVEGTPVVTYDIRMLKPNSDLLNMKAVHSIEHIVATYVRNSRYKDRVIYFGPMGCRTGFYFITKDYLEDIRDFIREAFVFVCNATEIPGVSEVECGSYLEHNLQEARLEALAYVNILKIKDESRYNYPI